MKVFCNKLVNYHTTVAKNFGSKTRHCWKIIFFQQWFTSFEGVFVTRYCQNKPPCLITCWILASGPCPILYFSAISKPALRSSNLPLSCIWGFCMIRRPQILCPAIGWRHSVWSKLTKYQKHTFAHTNLIVIQLTVLIYLFIVISIENPRVGGSIPPPGTAPYS